MIDALRMPPVGALRAERPKLPLLHRRRRRRSVAANAGRLFTDEGTSGAAIFLWLRKSRRF
jgi:hypothetical protein